ncbi:hypothetical protein Drorol1_Dr00004782 [Drosera rotundifolia]
MANRASKWVMQINECARLDLKEAACCGFGDRGLGWFILVAESLIDSYFKVFDGGEVEEKEQVLMVRLLTAASAFFTGCRRTPASRRPHHTISLISPPPSPSAILSSCPVASIVAALHSISPSPTIRHGPLPRLSFNFAVVTEVEYMVVIVRLEVLAGGGCFWV